MKNKKELKQTVQEVVLKKSQSSIDLYATTTKCI